MKFKNYLIEKTLPDNITKALMKAIKDGKKSSWKGGFFRVMDKKVNDFLTKKLNLNTNDNEQDIDNAFIVDYNWTANEWVVK